MKMICKSCKSQEENLRLLLMANFTFLVGSTNYRRSFLKEHTGTECHKAPYVRSNMKNPRRLERHYRHKN